MVCMAAAAVCVTDWQSDMACVPGCCVAENGAHRYMQERQHVILVAVFRSWTNLFSLLNVWLPLLCYQFNMIGPAPLLFKHCVGWSSCKH